MSAYGDGSSNANNSSPPLPLTCFPMSVGFWHKPEITAGVQTIFSFMDGASFGATGLQIFRIVANRFGAQVVAGGTDTVDAFGPTVIAGAWYYLVFRGTTSFLNLSVLSTIDGGIAAATPVATTATPTTFNELGIAGSAALNQAKGWTAELWYTNTDIQPDALSLNDATMRQLAFNGPFSIPAVRDNLLEYKSLRANPVAGNADDVFFGRKAQYWVNSGLKAGPHPPLVGFYPRAIQSIYPAPFIPPGTAPPDAPFAQVVM